MVQCNTKLLHVGNIESASVVRRRSASVRVGLRRLWRILVVRLWRILRLRLWRIRLLSLRRVSLLRLWRIGLLRRLKGDIFLVL